MYKYHSPRPIVINLCDELGFKLRQKAAEYVLENKNKTGAERGNAEEQGFGALAEIVVRNKLGLPDINPASHPLAYDLLLPSGVKVDVKCRGGERPFLEEYDCDDGLPREAKHNLFARQIYDDALDTDIYLMTHLETPSNRILPGTNRQRKWILYICGWVSKKRVFREGVYLPRGSLTEQGRTWFTYRGQEIEFYHRNLNGLSDVNNLVSVDKEDVKKDEVKVGGLNITSADALRIAYDLVGRGILLKDQIKIIEDKICCGKCIKPILHANQYFHLLEWLKTNKIITDKEIDKAKNIFKKEPYSGI